MSAKPFGLNDIWTLSGTVSRRQYLTVGLTLMAFKFLCEAALGYTLTGELPSPLVYIAPSIKIRNALLGDYDNVATVLGLMLWSLPFAWIGVGMSVRRARDANLPGWVGVGFFLPVLNYLVMALLSVLPTRAAAETPSQSPTRSPSHIAAAIQGVFAGGVVGLLLVALMATVLGKYGATVFIGTPFLMGVFAGFFYCRGADRSIRGAVIVGAMSQGVGALLLMLFAVEGGICLTMAVPITIPAGALGSLIGRALAGIKPNQMASSLSVPLMMLPLMTIVDEPQPTLRQVETRVVVEAPPERVWDVVVAFPEIPEDFERSWLFQAGVAAPLRARIEGQGVGAVRHCEFTTGAFVEPITVWQPPRHLAFDVTSQPEPMTEMSFWRHVHAPHLVNGTLRSERGEFRLNPLPGGKTELIGRTWYRVRMEPEPYWSTWVDVIVHQVHRRVLKHIAHVSAAKAAGH